MFTSKISQGPSTAVGKKGEKNSGNEVSQVVLFHSVFVFVFFAIPPPPPCLLVPGYIIIF